MSTVAWADSLVISSAWYAEAHGSGVLSLQAHGLGNAAVYSKLKRHAGIGTPGCIWKQPMQGWGPR